MAKARSVFSKLDEINENTKQKTISEMIGESFDDYFEKSEIYYLEDDKRKFDNFKLKAIKKEIIKLVLLFCLVIIEVVFACLGNINLYALILFSLLFLLFLFPLVYVLKAKQKVLVKKKSNVEIIEFYFYKNYLRNEVKRGYICYFVQIIKIIIGILLIGLIPITAILLKDLKSTHVLLHLIIDLSTVFWAFPLVLGSDIPWYYSYDIIFDTEKSFVRYDGYTFTKEMK